MLRIRRNSLGGWRTHHPYSVRKNSVVIHPTLLLVDDDEQVLRVAKRLLGDTWDIATAKNAIEAAEILRTRTFDTILTDYDMPGQNGIWLLIEAMRTHPKARRVLFSGSVPRDLMEHLHSGVVHCFVSKPTSRSELIESLSQH
jgi:DNA-binding NtrC family response regulator